jgi:6-phosphogluconolactonase
VSRSSGSVEWQVLADASGVRDAALQRIVAAATRAQEERGVFHVALAGGNTPRQLYEAWRHLEQFDWQRTEIFWGDERAVPASDKHSNYKMAWDALLRHVAIPKASVHRMPADETDLDQAARRYEALLRRRLEPGGRLDLVLLGLGADGHTASLFPGMASLSETQRWVVSTPAPVIAPRLSGTPVLFNAARQVVFLVTGAEKRQAVLRIRGAHADPKALPALLIQPRDGTLTWLLDRQASGGSTLP